jgi:hypothetical protein
VVVKGTNIGSATASDGTYRIPNVPTGEQVIRVQFVGYTAQERTVIVEEGETLSINFTLRESAVNLDEVVVTGTGARHHNFIEIHGALPERKVNGQGLSLLDDHGSFLRRISDKLNTNYLLTGRHIRNSVRPVACRGGTDIGTLHDHLCTRERPIGFSVDNRAFDHSLRTNRKRK